MAKWLLLKEEKLNNDILDIIFWILYNETVQTKTIQIIVLYLLLVQISVFQF